MAKRHSNHGGNLESMFLRLEELVLANSGEDEFEEVFKLLVAKLYAQLTGQAERFTAKGTQRETARQIHALLRDALEKWPGILEEDARFRLVDEHLHVCVEALAMHDVSRDGLDVLDSFFEFMVSRTAKGNKGQYFTPRYVVDFCVRMLKPRSDETVLDPACGSGGFLFHALAYVRQAERLDEAAAARYCSASLWGFDIDPRAIRVAKALMVLAGDGRSQLFRLNSLLRPDMAFLSGQSTSGDFADLTVEHVVAERRPSHEGFDVILTNPPFAGEVMERHILDGYHASRGKQRVERDVLFIERCVDLLRPGGRLAMVLPHNKFASSEFANDRARLLNTCKVLGVVALPRNTFLPHTHQKASILFLQKRASGGDMQPDEDIFLAVSEREGKNTKGKLRRRPGAASNGPQWTWVDHDLEDIERAFSACRAGETISFGAGSAGITAKRISELGPALVLAPERYDMRRSALHRAGDESQHVVLGDIVDIVTRTVSPASKAASERTFIVLDTSDVREGFIVGRKVRVAGTSIGSTKKTFAKGDVLVSRLRPYLRQVGIADHGFVLNANGAELACSTEFFVLRSKSGMDIGFLVPYLLSAPVQEVLAAAQEGGHHPRFDESVLLSLPLPSSLLENQAGCSHAIAIAANRYREAESLVQEAVRKADAIIKPE
ncbi:N-6 DNA methylase [Noviherbaspirillum galbum]|uniref:N-6 DNA methylase n=1 Tax=Noviherbaspirillum galbum TaxID=2709383 RepID=A0A6B3SWE3_9BURK|nr:N-6 DNA methylase [Noviherbaspirillum galbum]NEX63745.1 N-6 DNA methylase [Noviherbaspirillum galbum]